MHQSLYFFLPHLLQDFVFDKKEAMPRDVSSKGIRNTQLSTEHRRAQKPDILQWEGEKYK